MTKIAQEAVAVAAVAFHIALQTKEAIKKDQDVIRGNLLSLDQAVHSNAVQCMLHAEKHGDTSLMRRLLVETLGGKNGYRTRGLINWMRINSPMELKGDIINLSGTDEKGAKRPFLLEQANNTPFWNDSRNDEAIKFKPIFKDTLLSGVDKMIKDAEAMAENTVNGKPVDPKKPYYDGLNLDTVIDFAQKVKAMRDALPSDETRSVRLAQAEQKRLGAFIDSNKDNVAADPLTKTA